MNKRTLIAIIIAGVGVVGACVSATFVPLRAESRKVYVTEIYFDNEKLEYKARAWCDFETNEVINEWYTIKDFKPADKYHGVGFLVTHYDLWGNFKFKSLENVYGAIS